MIRPIIYVAGKTSEAQAILDLYASHPEVIWMSSWPYAVLSGEAESSVNAKLFWQHDILEVSRADMVLVLPGDPLRGALVEAGAALGLGKFVIIVGDCDSYGTWRFHPKVFHAADIPSAIKIARGIL